MIELESITIDYNGKKVVEDFSLVVNAGEVVALTGKSGSGKSSILYSIAMLKEISKGNIIVNGVKNPTMNSQAGNKIYQNHLGFIFQDFLLVKDKTVKENLELVKFDSSYNVEKALTFVGMESFINYNISELSGGQQQRIAIARLFMKPFDIVLGDEITGSLDDENKHEVLQLISELKAMGKAIILVTHDKEVAQFCDREVKINESEMEKN